MSSSDARMVLGLCIFSFGILKLALKSGRYPGKLPNTFLVFRHLKQRISWRWFLVRCALLKRRILPLVVLGNTHLFCSFRSTLRILSLKGSRYRFSTRRISFDLYRQYLFVIGRRNSNSTEDVQAPKRRLGALLCVTPGKSETLSTQLYPFPRQRHSLAPSLWRSILDVHVNIASYIAI